ncbi:hypothetical protein AB0J28_13235 [Streptosporangium canum]|uniref:hypothetical protein n=1 Tax=Streptosporangium canum TaxID=324952 RepID=UPI003443B2E5
MQTVTPVHDESLPEKRTSTGLAWGCLAMVVLPVIGLFLLLKIPMWINDAKLTKMMGQAHDYPLPPETNFFGHDDDVEGSMEKRGNGDGCDYRVRLSLETLLSEEEIVDYYRKARFPGVDDSPAWVTVYFPRFSTGFVEGSIRKDLIVELSAGHSEGLDFRCN